MAIVKAALATALGAKPLASAMAFMVWLAPTVMAALYGSDAAVGVEPSVV